MRHREEPSLWRRLSLLAALAGSARGQFVVTNLPAPANGSLPAACMPLQTIPDGSRCGQLSDWSCEFGFTPSGTLPLCTGSQFSPGSVRCVGNPCDQDPRVDAPVIVGMKQGLNRDLNQPGDFLGAFDVSRTCRGTASGKQCPFHCSDGLRPSGPLTCTAGDFDTQTCVEIDACQSWPCGVSFSCTDISATSGGLDNAVSCVYWLRPSYAPTPMGGWVRGWPGQCARMCPTDCGAHIRTAGPAPPTSATRCPTSPPPARCDRWATFPPTRQRSRSPELALSLAPPATCLLTRPCRPPSTALPTDMTSHYRAARHHGARECRRF
jgi:hypothetical protein